MFLAYRIQRYFFSVNIIDSINNRSSHKVKATRSGGLTIFSSIFIISSIHYIANIEIYDFSIIIPISILMLIGLYDDLYTVGFKLKFIFQIIAAKILIDNGFIIDNLHGVFGIYELGRIAAQTLTIFIIVAIINSINFIDGIDGLALFTVGGFLIAFEFFALEATPFVLFSKILLFSFIPLLYFNLRSNNKIFLGDSGSLLLGGIVSAYVIHILSNDYIIKPTYDLHKILFVLSILAYPIIDIVRVFFLRIINRKSPFEADQNHIHHLILQKTNNHFFTTFIIVLSSIFFIILVQTLL